MNTNQTEKEVCVSIRGTIQEIHAKQLAHAAHQLFSCFFPHIQKNGLLVLTVSIGLDDFNSQDLHDSVDRFMELNELIPHGGPL